MADKKEKKEEPAEESGAPKAPKGPLFIALGNVVVALVAMGFLVYTKVLYQRPQITEEGERVQLEKVNASPKPAGKVGLIVFEPITLNVESVPDHPHAADGTNRQIEGKLHYATVGFTLEIRDEANKEAVEGLRPQIMDRFMSLLGRKTTRDLTTVQGRYLLRMQLLDAINTLAGKRSEKFAKEALVSNIYFTQFIVQ